MLHVNVVDPICHTRKSRLYIIGILESLSKVFNRGIYQICVFGKRTPVIDQTMN